jgi:hypothetical protein
MAEGGEGRAKRYLGLTGAVVGVVVAGSGLLFTLAPGTKPCLGDSNASFTGAPVFPKVHFHDYLIRNGGRKEDLAGEPNLRGAEVRFSYRTSGLRGKSLTVTWSLMKIERDDTVGAVVAGQDRALAMTFSPAACTEDGGKDVFMQIPEPGKRYRVVLELYRDKGLTDRIALTESDPFRG